MRSSSGSDPLLARGDGMAGQDFDDVAVAAVDHRGRPASRASTGRWRSALFIIAVEIAERFSFYGVSANLISYLTGPLGEGLAKAASAINLWNGVAQMVPLLGAALADSWLGRYRTILLASLLYILGLGMLSLSTLLSSGSHKCGTTTAGRTPCSPPSGLQMAAFYTSLYLVALAQGGHKPCVQAFGADQFDESDPREAVSRSSFFNWWYFGICAGTAVTLIFLSYIQDNIGWGLGFGIPCVVMAFALAVFLLGTRTYRYYVSDSKQRSLFARAGEAFAAWRNNRRKSSSPVSATSAPESSAQVDEEEQEVVMGNADLLEEAKSVLRLFPIWATCLIYAVAFSQSSTFFTKQAATLDRRVGHGLQVPPAALQSFISITIVVLMPLYDRVLVPLARRYTGVSSGITLLQRIGTGMLLSLVSMCNYPLPATRDRGVSSEHGRILGLVVATGPEDDEIGRRRTGTGRRPSDFIHFCSSISSDLCVLLCFLPRAFTSWAKPMYSH